MEGLKCGLLPQIFSQLLVLGLILTQANKQLQNINAKIRTHLLAASQQFNHSAPITPLPQDWDISISIPFIAAEWIVCWGGGVALERHQRHSYICNSLWRGKVVSKVKRWKKKMILKCGNTRTLSNTINKNKFKVD